MPISHTSKLAPLSCLSATYHRMPLISQGSQPQDPSYESQYIKNRSYKSVRVQIQSQGSKFNHEKLDHCQFWPKIMKSLKRAKKELSITGDPCSAKSGNAAAHLKNWERSQFSAVSSFDCWSRKGGRAANGEVTFTLILARTPFFSSVRVIRVLRSIISLA